MKPAPPDRSIPRLRPLRSLSVRSGTIGKRDGACMPAKLIERRRTFKPLPTIPQNKINCAMQGKSVARRTRCGISSKDSTRMSRRINSSAAMEKFPQLNGIFLRPSIDVRSFCQQFKERAKRLGEALGSEEGQSKIINSPTPGVRTPKPSGLSRAYLKLSESNKKSGALKKVPLSPPSYASPFEERIICNGTKADACKGHYGKAEKVLNFCCTEDSATSCDAIFDKENDSPRDWGAISNAKNLSTKCCSNVENVATEAAGKTVNGGNTRRCALEKVLEHCRLYAGNMSTVNDAMAALDDSFLRVVVGGIGGELQTIFCEYQRGKLELYTKMELLERELEKWVKSEIDVPSKFKDYLREKKKVSNARQDLQENFENIVKRIIEKYEKEKKEPGKREKWEDITKTPVPGEASRSAPGGGEPTLRRSKRLATTRASDAGTDGNEVVTSRNAVKDDEEADELVAKKGSKSLEKKRIQRCIYKDLQKSFNLCSPECSF